MAREPGFSSLCDLLSQRAVESDRCGYTFLREDGSAVRLSWRDLDRRARRLASALARRLRPGDRVLLVQPAGLEFLVAFFGCLYARLLAAPLPPPGSRTSIEKILPLLNDAGARMALTDGPHLAAARASLPGVAWETAEALEAEGETGWEPATPESGGLAYLQYTSGSTSTPRGVMLTHANVLHNLANIDAGFRHGPESVVVSWLPHFHDMGLVYGLLAPLYGGFPGYWMAPATFVGRPRVWLEAITAYRATHSGGPNFAYELCVRRIGPEERAGLDLSSWEVAFNGAEPVQAETLERFARAFAGCGFRPGAFYPAYGLAEATLKVSGGERGRGPVVFSADAAWLQRHRVREAAGGGARRLVGCGRPGLDTRVEIVDPETGRRCAPDEIGEIWVSGPGVAQGYWGRPEETRETFGARLADTGEGPFLRTGDLGFLDDGELYIAGRLKDLVIIRGLNHHPNDIEETARRAHAEVASSLAAAFAVETEGEERLALVMEAGRKAPEEPARLVAAIREAIAREHEVQLYAFALVPKGAVPRTSSGKVQRRLCRIRYLAGELPLLYHEVLPAVEEAAGEEPDPAELGNLPPAEREERLAAWLCRAAARRLGLPAAAIDAARPLVGYGLDSLAALELAHELERALGVELPLEAVLEGASVTQLAALVAGKLEAGAVAVPLRARRLPAAPLSFEQERLWLLEQLAPGNPAYHIPVAFRVRGRLDEGRLRRAVENLMARQASLRSSIRPGEGGPVAMVEEGVEAPLVVEAAAGFEDARQRAEAEARRPFDLQRAPLWRLRLYRFAPEETLLVAVMHHLIGDLWSVRLFFEELFEIYDAVAEGRPPVLVPLGIDYGDYAAWQREQLTAERQEELERWWREHLRGAARLELAPGKGLSPKPPYRAGAIAFEIDGGLLGRIRETARSRGATLFTVLAGALAAVVARWKGETDLLFAVTTARRSRPELERLIGYFAAPTLMRLDLRGDPELGEIVERTRHELAAVHGHQELPFARVARAAGGGERAPAPLLLSVVRGPLVRREAGELSFEAVEIDTGATDFDLFVTLVEEEDRLRGRAVFNRELLEAATVQAVVESCRLALERLVESPGARLSSVALAGELSPRRLIAVAATFTADPVGEVLEFWMRELGLEYQIRFAPYHQVFQQLLDPGSLLRANRDGVNLVLLRVEDWLKGATPVESVSGEFAAALRAAAAQTGSPYIVCLCPGGRTEQDQAAGRKAEEALVAALAGCPAVRVVRAEEVAALYPVEVWRDEHADELGHVPYTPEYFAALGTFLARRIHALRAARYKVIAVDADQTLWHGVAAEDGPEGVTLTEGHRRLQQFLRAQQEAGMLLALVSKNNEADLEAVFAAHPEMPLGSEDFVAWRANWRPKSENLQELARELDLGLDSFIFIDDNPAECAEVEAGCPEVLTLELPREPSEIPAFLAHVWAFDRWATTAEDRRRAALYAEGMKRVRLAHQVGTLREFLELLQLEVRIEPAKKKELPRVAQLTQRTNQMNTAPRQRTEAEVAALLERGEAECLAVHVRDRFGSYGLVGVMICRTADEVLDVDTFLLSCRALGRGVEHRMLAHLGSLAEQRACRYVRLRYLPTARNQPALAFLEAVGAQWAQPAEGGLVYRFPAARAAAVTYDPEARPVAVQARVRVAAGAAPAAVDYGRIARELRDPAKILERIRQERPPAVKRGAPFVAPRTPLEEELALLWAEMLGVEAVGAEDDFFDLGGHSLLAVQLLGRVRERFQAELPLDVVFGGDFTVAAMARAIELEQMEKASPEEYAALLRELEGLSEEELRARLEEERGEGPW